MFSSNSNGILNIDINTKFESLDDAFAVFDKIIYKAVESDRNLEPINNELISVRVNVLKDSLKEFFSSDLTFSDICKKLVFKASILCKDADTTFWGLVAGRLRTFEFWNKVKPYNRDIQSHIQAMVDSKVYGKQVLQRTSVFSSEDLEELNNTIDPEYDLTFNTSAVIVAMGKYLRPFKNPQEAIQQMYMVNAMIIGSRESDPEYRLKFTKELYTLLATRKLSLATPWLANLRGDGNISSCFILEMEDDLESIIGGWADIARISKQGGGVGVYIGNMRAKGAVVNGVRDAAKGINSWTGIINNIASTVDQGGVRKGAVTVAVPVFHRDVDDFLEIQTEVGDLRKKSFDIFPQVTAPDIFFRHCKENKPWLTFCPKEVREITGIDVAHVYGEEFEKAYYGAVEAHKAGKLTIYKEYKSARDILKHIMRSQLETGMPYIAMTDAINRANPNNHAGFIPSVNLCTESFSVVKAGKWTHCCNLASIVMTNIYSSAELEYVTRIATRVLDYGIGLSNPPTLDAAAHNDAFRTIGIGITGLHDFLARNYQQFTNTKLIATIAKQIEYYAIDESVNLSQEYGAYGEFEGSKWHTGEKIFELAASVKELDATFDSNAFLKKWEGETPIDEAAFLRLQERINQSGIRNSQLTSPAPNTGTSIITESSASILPIYSAFFIESGGEGLKPQYGTFIEQNPLHYSRNFAKYTSEEINTYVGWMQRFIDTGISMEMIFDRNDPSFNALKIYNAIMDAWEKGLKSIYYVRTIKEGSSFEALVNSKAEHVCVSCAN